MKNQNNNNQTNKDSIAESIYLTFSQNWDDKHHRTEFYKYTDLMDYISDHKEYWKSKAGYRLWYITGASGLGKSFLSAQIAGQFKVHSINLDSHASKSEDGKWNVNWPEVKHRILESGFTIMEGVADNISEVHKIGGVSALVIPIADYETFGKIMVAKAKGLAKTPNFNKDWYDGYLKKSEFSPSEYKRYIINKTSLYAKHTGAEKVIFVEMKPADITRGWH